MTATDHSRRETTAPTDEEQPLTRQYLDLRLAELEHTLVWKVVLGAMVGLTAICAVIVGLLA